MFDQLVSKYAGSVIRHALTGLGGALLLFGVSEAEAHSFTAAAAPVLTGIVSYAVGQGASLLEKRFHR